MYDQVDRLDISFYCWLFFFWSRFIVGCCVLTEAEEASFLLISPAIINHLVFFLVKAIINHLTTTVRNVNEDVGSNGHAIQ